MVKISLLGIPHDDNSHFMKGAAEAPPLIRSDLHSDQPIVAADIVEYNPRCDVSNMTAIVAAKLLRRLPE